MPEKYLYDRLVEEFGRRTLKDIEIPDSITKNLNPRYGLRPYQIDAFQRFICYFTERFDFKEYPAHLLFNMATGSGKTLIMAGLILYLYEQGYRDFLFFVHFTNIIEKTKDNFLNPNSIKYLFGQDIHIANRRVRVTPVENFEAVNPQDINIGFTTIQKLHSDMTTDRENALTFEDFRKHRIVLIADEAHHMSVRTRAQREMFESWENTVECIFTQNEDNLLLEFTATHDYETPAMIEKYRNKVIIRYDLVQFRDDGYSKDVFLVRSDFELRERILQALILSQYKQEVAAKYRINLKPVILFKAQRTIAQSLENQANFHRLIEDLSAEDIATIRHRSNLELIHRAFNFFDAERVTDAQLAERLKREFQEDFCLSVNEEKEKKDYQIIVNTLEDKNNRVRAIFAVDKLKEGWDVLNLFDIVRCYEPRDTGRSKIGATTVSEAQLIGRGARYFPFTLPQYQDRFRRKFDDDIQHELRVLEQLHYHSINDSRYIAEIRQALIAEGMMDETEVTCKLKLKEPFKATNFYKYGVVWLNDRRVKNYQYVQSFADLGVKKRNHLHVIATGHGGMTAALDGERNVIVTGKDRRDVKVRDIERNIVQSALARTPFFTFANIKRYFPNLVSMRDFIAAEDYLDGLEITFQGNIEGLEENRFERLSGVLGLLKQIEAEIRANITEYEGFHSSTRDIGY